MFQNTELCPDDGRKWIEMALCVIKQGGLFVPLSILSEADFVRKPNPWGKDSAAAIRSLGIYLTNISWSLAFHKLLIMI
jgi:hypothetical protein